MPPVENFAIASSVTSTRYSFHTPGVKPSGTAFAPSPSMLPRTYRTTGVPVGWSLRSASSTSFAFATSSCSGRTRKRSFRCFASEWWFWKSEHVWLQYPAWKAGPASPTAERRKLRALSNATESTIAVCRKPTASVSTSQYRNSPGSASSGSFQRQFGASQNALSKS